MSAGRSIAVLCSGPSLSAFLAGPVRHDLYVGVNRAVIAHPCDYWAFHDAEGFEAFEPLGRPVCFTPRAAFERIKRRERIDAFRWLFHDAIRTNCPSAPGWTHFTVTEALVLCEYLQARRITVYGCDQTGVDDFDGPPPSPVTRTVARWNSERHKFDHVTAWLASCGIEVVRARPLTEVAA
jgi:hypothetical protein